MVLTSAVGARAVGLVAAMGEAIVTLTDTLQLVLDLGQPAPQVGVLRLLCCLTSKNGFWQQRQLRIKGKGGPHGKKTKVRALPVSNRVRALIGRLS
jgi:hypothetical protein